MAVSWRLTLILGLITAFAVLLALGIHTGNAGAEARISAPARTAVPSAPTPTLASRRFPTLAASPMT